MLHFTVSRLGAIAGIFRDIAQVFFASVFVGPLVNGDTDIIVAVIGLALSIGFWYASILLIRE